jgi:hypothetical protein
VGKESRKGNTFADFEADIAPVNGVNGWWWECHVVDN